VRWATKLRARPARPANDLGFPLGYRPARPAAPPGYTSVRRLVGQW
jgi:hypothetical protein